MSGVLIVWANLPDEGIEWYEDEYIPAMHAKHSIHTMQCEYVENGFEGEPIGKLDSPWPLCAVYEVSDFRKATDACYDKGNHPPDALLAGPLAKARFDTRTYRELKRWQAEDWDGDASNIASVTAMEWHVSTEMQAEVVEWYTSYCAPKISTSSDVLRFRIFEVDNATVLQGSLYETKAKESLHTYFTLVEFETEDWPWDVVIELAENEQWRQYFEGQKVVSWQNSHYIVKRLYKDDDKAAHNTNSDATLLDSGGGTSSE